MIMTILACGMIVFTYNIIIIEKALYTKQVTRKKIQYWNKKLNK